MIYIIPYRITQLFGNIWAMCVNVIFRENAFVNLCYLPVIAAKLWLPDKV